MLFEIIMLILGFFWGIKLWWERPIKKDKPRTEKDIKQYYEYMDRMEKEMKEREEKKKRKRKKKYNEDEHFIYWNLKNKK